MMGDWDEGSGYDPSDPKHPDYRERMAERADHDRKAARENAEPPKEEVKDE